MPVATLVIKGIKGVAVDKFINTKASFTAEYFVLSVYLDDNGRCPAGFLEAMVIGISPSIF